MQAGDPAAAARQQNPHSHFRTESKPHPSIKRYLKCLLLFALAPLAHFVGFYLAGRGVIDVGFGMFIGGWSLYPLILGVGLVFGFAAPSSSNFVRFLSCIAAIAAQFALVGALPGGARAEVMGVAHRLKREFPIAEVRDTADHLLEKYQAKTLTVAATETPGQDIWSETVFVVDNSDLPATLRERFRWVQIRRVPQGFTQDLQVFFFIDWGQSIVCDSRPSVSNAHLHSIEKGVHAYHTPRS